MFNYQKISQNLLSDLPERTRDVLERRFGLKGEGRETLESIGKSYGITRERIRQIEEDGLKRVKQKEKEILFPVYKYFAEKLKKFGNLKREDLLLAELAPKSKNPVFFLLTLGDDFERFLENERFYTFWASDRNSFELAQKTIDSTLEKLKQKKQPLRLKDFPLAKKIGSKALQSFLEISKEIMQNPEGLYGLKDWPEINPRNVQDKAYIVFKKEKKPLHFTEIASLISKLSFEGSSQKVLYRTVHNGLIKDPRFVLVGRGLYALREWGYEPGVVKDLIFKILKESKKPLEKEKIIQKVLKQRMVKPNTILLNLQDHKYFIKDSKDRYTIKEA